VFFDFNGALLDYVADPVSYVWRGVTPSGFRRHLSLFGSNLWAPVRIVSNLLIADLQDAGIETGRFVVNTAFGFFGYFDSATAIGLRAPPPQDVGQAFAQWGWEAHFYLHLPVLGPSSDRDIVGGVVDLVLDPATYFWPLRPLLLGNTLSDHVNEIQRLEHTSEDAYEVVRAAMGLYRDRMRVSIGEAAPPTAAMLSLGAVFFDAQDPDFFGRRETRSVVVPATGRELPYSLWLHDGAAPLVFIVPGLGTYRLSGQSVGLAEMAWESGCSVVTMSSSLHPEFMERAAAAPMPGFLPWDVADVRVALDEMRKDLDATFPGRFTRRALVGLSLGALESLMLATDPDSGAWDAVVAINPPVSMEHALEQLDALYRSPLRWPAEEREDRIRQLLEKVVSLAEPAFQPASSANEAAPPISFEPWEAEYLIGLSFRWTLRSAIFNSQLRAPTGVLLTELDPHDSDPAYREIEHYGYMKYVYAFLLPAVVGRVPDVNDDTALFARGDLRTRAAALAADARLRVITNRDDFLLGPGDIEWLERTFGNRLALFDTGGHLGNLGQPGVRLVIEEALREAVGPSRSP
jgi:ABC-type transporter lipoprotein component MlaA